jgi:hypothetical protein
VSAVTRFAATSNVPVAGHGQRHLRPVLDALSRPFDGKGSGAVGGRGELAGEGVLHQPVEPARGLRGGRATAHVSPTFTARFGKSRRGTAG